MSLRRCAWGARLAPALAWLGGVGAGGAGRHPAAGPTGRAVGVRAVRCGAVLRAVRVGGCGPDATTHRVGLAGAGGGSGGRGGLGWNPLQHPASLWADDDPDGERDLVEGLPSSGADVGASGPRPDAPVPGQRWRFTARLKRVHGARNPGGFDYELWLWEQGILATGWVRARSASQVP